MTGYSLKGKKISHIGVVVTDIDRRVREIWEMFRIGPWRLDQMPGTVPTWRYGRPVSNPQRLAFADWNGLQIELIQPLPGADSPCQDFLKASGGRGGIHHVGLLAGSLEELEQMAQYLRDRGFQESLLARAVGPAGDGDTYIFDTRELLGFCLELSAPITITAEMLAGEKWYPEKRAE